MSKFKLRVINKSGHPLVFSEEGDSGKNVSAWFGDNPESLQIDTYMNSNEIYPTSVHKDHYSGSIYVVAKPNERMLIPTGIFPEIPKGYEIQVRPRSGRSLRKGLNVILGTIDSNYRGEIKVIVHNISTSAFVITEGEEIAQIVLCPVVHGWETEEVETLSETERGENGFGSTDCDHDLVVKFGVAECQNCGEEV